jgi:hypothetical protein
MTHFYLSTPLASYTVVQRRLSKFSHGTVAVPDHIENRRRRVNAAIVISIPTGCTAPKFLSGKQDLFAREAHPCRRIDLELTREVFSRETARGAVSTYESSTMPTVQSSRKSPQRDFALHTPVSGRCPLLLYRDGS